MEADDDAVSALRGFSRFYTRRLALLDESLLGGPFSLAEARVLYELAQVAGPTGAAATGRALRLDPGYLSRILKRFERDGLLRRSRSASDARQAELALTPAGREAFATLDRASAAQAAGLLAPLPPEARRGLAAALRAVEAALDGEGAADEPVAIRDLRPGDVGHVAGRHGAIYAAEFGWNGVIEALAAEIGAAFLRDRDPARERAFVAERGGAILGSAFLMRGEGDDARLRLVYVEPEARGLGLGRRLVAEAIAFARAAGYRTATLWTNDALVSARRIYEAAGFRLVASEPHERFGPPMVGQTWTLDL